MDQDLQAAIDRHVARSEQTVARIPPHLRTILSKSEAQARSASTAEPKDLFEELAHLWELAISNVSSMNQAKRMAPYDALVSFGKEAVPWVKNRLARSRFWAGYLEEITGVRQERGSVDQVHNAWMEWYNEPY